VLADSEQALASKRKRWRAASPLLQRNELGHLGGFDDVRFRKVAKGAIAWA
jgi:hypothetical protein